MIPKEVITVLDKINKTKEAYLVGGAVRDLVLNKEPHDFDIATNMSVEELQKLFPHNFESGVAFGIITVFENGHPYEVAHFREDLDYKDCRHPDIAMIETIEGDLKRRDFTINAMAWRDGKVLDLFGGKKDIEDKIIRAVGNADARIKEDALRMLRAIRFSAQLDFKIDEELKEAIKENAHLIQKISWERIEAEITKILISNHPEKIRLIHELGISKFILPEFDRLFECEQNSDFHFTNVGDHTIEVIKNIKNDKILRWAALLHDMGKPDTKQAGEDGKDHFQNHAEVSFELSKKILRRFKISNEDSRKILWLVKNHDNYNVKKSTIRSWIANEGKDIVFDLLELQFADGQGQTEKGKLEKEKSIPKFKKQIEEIEKENSAFTKRDLKVNGFDLMELGFKGKEIGDILEKLYLEVLEHPEMNDREILLERIEKE